MKIKMIISYLEKRFSFNIHNPIKDVLIELKGGIKINE